MAEKRQKLPPDQDQRGLILDALGKTMLVEAAAGTGKTTSMIGRMTALIASGGCGAEMMAAVTFTRKAAAELRLKFQVALEKKSRAAAPGDEKKRLENALANVERCYIGTIHSFCARLLRERPLEAGVNISFEELEEPEDLRLKREAWDRYAAKLHASEDPIIGELDALDIEIASLAGAYMRLADYPDVEEWPAERAELPDFGPARGPLHEYIAHIDDLMHVKIVELLLRGPLLEYIAHIDSIAPTFPADTGSDWLMPAYKTVSRMVGHTNLNDPAGMAAALALFRQKAKITQKMWPGGPKQAKDEQARWNAFSEQFAIPLTGRWYESRYEPSLRAIRGAAALYENIKNERGRLNFQDLLMKTAALLRDKPHIRKYFRSRFTHLLVDEFQDTDPIQAEIMMLLTADDPNETDWRKCRPVDGSLFVVGDPKQSIYRFRRADIVTYNQVKKIIEENGGLTVSLSASFRTVAQLVEWINGVFEGVFPEKATEHSPQRRDLMVGRTGGSDGQLAGLNIISIPKEINGGKTNKDVAIEIEADLIARTIRNAIDRGLTVPRTETELADGVPPEAQPGDFMIVTYNRKHLSAYAEKLEELGIPHQVTGGSSLNDIGQLTLLHACLAALARPDNPVALVAALRSPLFGISDTALYDFKRAGGKFNFKYGAPAEGLGAEDARAIGDAFERLKRYSSLIGKLPPVAAIEIIAADLGLFAQACGAPGGNALAGGMAKAMELMRAAGSDGWSASELVEFLAGIIDTENKDDRYDGVPARSSEKSVVRLMNLHKAKGLEAPVVFLAAPAAYSEHAPELHVDRAAGKTTGYMTVCGEPVGMGKPPLIAKPAGWETFSEKERLFEEAEDERLMYVAATRAGSQLTIVQRESYNNFNPWKFFSGRLSETAPLPDTGPQQAPAAVIIQVTPSDIDSALAEIRKRRAAAGEPTYAAAAAKKISIDETRAPYPAGEHGTEWGSAIHSLLEIAMRNHAADLRAIAETIFDEEGLDKNRVHDALETVAAMRRSEIWKRALASGRRFVEVPFQTMMPSAAGEKVRETLVRGYIDLVFRDKGGWVVVDYKTDSLKGRSVEKLAEYYHPQLRTYAAAWEKATGEPVAETGLFFTQGGRYVVQ